MTCLAVEVIKLGGSLLGCNDLPAALQRFLAEHERRHLVLIVGGGPQVNAIRGIAHKVPIDESAAHWLAIEAMECSGLLVASWLPELSIAKTLGELEERIKQPGGTLMLTRRFLRNEEPLQPGTKLPIGWQVTSDSIAARIAICIGAARLRLLKSREPTKAESNCWRVAAEGGLVDVFFPTLAHDISQVCCETLPEA